MRKAISVTLSEDNILWLRGQAARSSPSSVSELLNRLVGEARTGGRTDPAAVRSVVGSVDLPDDDPELAGADAHIRAMFVSSARDPMLVRERAPRARKAKKPRG